MQALGYRAAAAVVHSISAASSPHLSSVHVWLYLFNQPFPTHMWIWDYMFMNIYLSEPPESKTLVYTSYKEEHFPYAPRFQFKIKSKHDPLPHTHLIHWYFLMDTAWGEVHHSCPQPPSFRGTSCCFCNIGGWKGPASCGVVICSIMRCGSWMNPMHERGPIRRCHLVTLLSS